MKRVRSDSTIELRTRLNNDYVLVPSIRNTTPLSKYFDILYATLTSAKQFDVKNLLSQSYIDYKKFLKLFLSLSKHNEYKSKQVADTILILEKEAKDAFDKLESVVFRMDEAEDKRRELERKDSSILELIDLFDNADVIDNQNMTTIPSDNIWTELMKLKKDSSPSKLSPLDILNPKNVFNDNIDVTTSIAHYPKISEIIPSSSSSSITAEKCNISTEDIQICSYLKDLKSFYIPPPFRSRLDITIGSKCYQFIKDDFHITFSAFLKDIPEELQMARSAVETNRCFFLHLAVAMNIHPFALQIAFRYLASKKLLQCSHDDMKVDVLNTVNEYAGFVDAYCLCFLWLKEFNSSRICIISGSQTKPMFSCFSLKDIKDSRDVIIYCDGSHFTLLKPFTPTINSDNFSILPQILMEAEQQGHIVHINELESNDNGSISDIIYMLINS